MAPLHLMALLPLRILYGISYVLAFVAHSVIRYRLKVVRRNLQLCFPEMTPKERKAIERKFYLNLCDVIVETIKLLHISDSQLHRRVELRNTDLVKSIAERGEPIILFLAHFGNWEWVPSLTLQLNEPKEMGALYKPLRNKVMNRVSLRLRARFKSQCIPVKTAYRTVVEMRRQSPSFMIGFIADQRALGVSLKHHTVFFGQETAFYAGGETIGDRVNARYVYLDVERERRGYYTLTFREIDPQEDKSLAQCDFPYTRRYFQMLEQSIRRQPYLWLWSHNRWKAFRRPTQK